MAETGVLKPDARVELLDGKIIDMSPIGPFHGGMVNRLIRWFSTHARGRWLVSAQNPLRLDDYSEPEPDLMLLRPAPDDYTSRHPLPEDVILPIEVSDTTLDYDLLARFWQTWTGEANPGTAFYGPGIVSEPTPEVAKGEIKRIQSAIDDELSGHFDRVQESQTCDLVEPGSSPATSALSPGRRQERPSGGWAARAAAIPVHKHRLDGGNGALLVFAPNLQLDSGSHRSAQEQNAQDAARIRDLPVAFQDDGGT